MNLEPYIGQEVLIQIKGERKWREAIVSESSKGLYVRYGKGLCDWESEIKDIKIKE